MMNTIKKHSPWFIWGLAALFYFYEFLLQVSLGVMVPDLMRSFSIDATKLGDLASVYFYTYALMQIPAGILLDKLGAKKLLTAACITCAFGTVLFAYSNSLLTAEIGRGFTGLGSAFAAIGCMSLAARWFEPKKFALLAGLMITIGMAGATAGQAPMALLVNTFGWRNTLLALGIIGVLLSGVIYYYIENEPNPTPNKHKKKTHLLAGLKTITKNKQSWVTAIYGGLMFAPTVAFTALWGVPALMRVHSISKPGAALIVSLIFIGWAIGCPLFGWLSDKIYRRKLPMYIASIGAFFTFSIAIYAPLPQSIVALLLFLYGFFSSGFVLAFSITREINPNEYSATSLGFTNMLNMIGGAVAQPLIGYILDRLWVSQMSGGIRVYSADHYQIALAILPFSILIAFILLPFIKETFCKQQT